MFNSENVKRGQDPNSSFEYTPTITSSPEYIVLTRSHGKEVVKLIFATVFNTTSSWLPFR